MKVKELISLLEDFKGDKNVIFETEDGSIVDEMVVQEGYEGVIVKSL